MICDLLNLIITRGDLIHVWCNQKCLQYSYWSSGNLRILIQEEIDFWSILFIYCFCMSFSFGSLIWK